ncbi:hypothetical protein F2P81_021102 [Scophthalmus maximus]|uniref:Par3/HAL N-terminal domain-containing protein n=1 Tax=Scophthalmus maximus TaxID=52904 RepID=A0A6A4S2B1_SCOMX|nr:hypothetical protein F2P81_021102 [Scophthalmus maximus]
MQYVPTTVARSKSKTQEWAVASYVIINSGRCIMSREHTHDQFEGLPFDRQRERERRGCQVPTYRGSGVSFKPDHIHPSVSSAEESVETTPYTAVTISGQFSTTVNEYCTSDVHWDQRCLAFQLLDTFLISEHTVSSQFGRDLPLGIRQFRSQPPSIIIAIARHPHSRGARVLHEEATAAMKVTVTFGQTGVVVPCKVDWTVRDLVQQATQRYRKLLEQEGDFMVRTHHVEYCDGGILDPDDILSDLVEDKDKLTPCVGSFYAPMKSIIRHFFSAESRPNNVGVHE